jgi:hypothetical protein
MAAGSNALARVPCGAALTARAGHGLRPARSLALLAGAAFACLATLALAKLPAPATPISRSLVSRPDLPSPTATRLPAGLAAAASSSIGTAERGFWPVRRAASLLTQGGNIHGTFVASGARLSVARGTLGLSLAALGRGRSLGRIAAVGPQAAANQILYRHSSISEFYRNGPYGLEQGFNLRQRPQPGTGSLVLALGLRGSLIPQQVGSQILFRTPDGATELRYGQLSVLDATGRQLSAQMQLRTGTLQLRIDDSGARYPLRIDPFIQQGEKLTGGGEAGEGDLGSTVALSADGSTALIGGQFDNNGVGAAWVFTRSGSTWSQQGGKLTGGGEVGEEHFGWSVALSDDGNTALIGGTSQVTGPSRVGAAWVFTRSATTWTQQGEKLTGGGEAGEGDFGFSVSLSNDGNTALIGGPTDNGNVGAAWVFTRSGSTWTQQGEKLTGSGASGTGQVGSSVALSGDGNTALIGGDNDNETVGAAWVFRRSGSTWTQQGSKLTGSGEIGAGAFGVSVALSTDGNTALIGGELDNESVGAAWVFTRSGTKWTQQGPKLTGSGETGEGQFGVGVALSDDGNTAMIGGSGDASAVGAAWVFTRSGTKWTQQGAKLTGSGESGKGRFGSSAALSGDGNTALIGGLADNGDLGAAWVFVNPPTIIRVSPGKGAAAGGTTVTITGTNFTGATAVKFGSMSAEGLAVKSATSITAVSPAEAVGTVDLTVTTPAGASAISTHDRFQFTPTVTSLSPNTGSKGGGTGVTVTGSGFVLGKTATTFAFGSAKATAVNCTSTTTCTLLSPAHAVGTVDVKATVSKVHSAKNSPADHFTYT